MYQQLSKELKASLFERIKSPFFGSFLIGLFIFNYRFLFILLSNKSLEDKFKLIDNVDSTNSIFNITAITIPYIEFILNPFFLSTLIYPFIFALFYIGIVPFFEYYISMPIWKKHQNRLKEKHAKLENEQIFTADEKSKYLKEILNIRKEKEKLVEELTNIDVINNKKIEDIKQKEKSLYVQKVKELEVEHELTIKNQKEELTIIYNDLVRKTSDEIKKIKEENSKLLELVKELEVRNKDSITKKQMEYMKEQLKNMKFINNIPSIKQEETKLL